MKIRIILEDMGESIEVEDEGVHYYGSDYGMSEQENIDTAISNARDKLMKRLAETNTEPIEDLYRELPNDGNG